MKILIAEDDRDSRRLLSLIFGDPTKYEVLEAKDGEEAVTLAECHQPDVILLDMLMPRMDGLEALEQLKAGRRTAHIPVVLMSAATRAEHIKRGTELGAAGFLQKPFEAFALEGKVKRWAEEREGA